VCRKGVIVHLYSWTLGPGWGSTEFSHWSNYCELCAWFENVLDSEIGWKYRYINEISMASILVRYLILLIPEIQRVLTPSSIDFKPLDDNLLTVKFQWEVWVGSYKVHLWTDPFLIVQLQGLDTVVCFFGFRTNGYVAFLSRRFWVSSFLHSCGLELKDVNFECAIFNMQFLYVLALQNGWNEVLETFRV